MGRSLLTRALLLAGLVLCFPRPFLWAQEMQEIETLASETAQGVAKTNQGTIIVASLSGCLLDTGICDTFETSLKTAVDKMIPGVRFMSNDDVAGLLRSHGFLKFDSYFGEPLRNLALKAGATLVQESLDWQPDGYEMTANVFDAKGNADHYRSKVPRSHGEAEGPLVFRDAESGVSLVISRGNPASSFQYPRCEKCPEPKYTPAARARHLEGMVVLLVTITEQGFAEQVGVVKSFDDGLTSAAVEAVRSWRFKPALGPDGKPFAMRTGVEVAFRLLRR